MLCGRHMRECSCGHVTLVCGGHTWLCWLVTNRHVCLHFYGFSGFCGSFLRFGWITLDRFQVYIVHYALLNRYIKSIHQLILRFLSFFSRNKCLDPPPSRFFDFVVPFICQVDFEIVEHLRHRAVLRVALGFVHTNYPFLSIYPLELLRHQSVSLPLKRLTVSINVFVTGHRSVFRLLNHL